MISKLLVYIKEYKWSVLLFFLFIVGEVVCELQVPRLMGSIIDNGIENSDSAYILRTGITMIAICLFAIACGIISRKQAAFVSQGFSHNLRVATFNKIQDFSFANIDRFTTASLITRLTNDINTIQSLLLQALRILSRAPIMMVTALIISLSISPKIASLLLVSMPLLVFCISILMVFTYRLFKIVQRKVDKLNRAIQENLISMRVVKSFVRKDYEEKKFRKANEELLQASLKASYIGILNSPIAGTIMNATVLVVYWVGANLIWGGEMQTGDLLAICTYITQIMFSLSMLTSILVSGARAKACAVRVGEVLDTEITITDPKVPAADAIQSSSVEFRDVSFRYEGEYGYKSVLQHVSFSVDAGETVAVLGGTGSGKSSLIKLIPRFYDPQEGAILIDGRDIREYTLSELRQNIGTVSQNNVLFSGSIRDNLLWGDNNATGEDLQAACRTAQIHDFIDSLPHDYDTLLNQDGVNVSGGQRQRLCIARALLKKPPILILDDSTSAIDTATETNLHAALKNELNGATVFIIAQRISSILHADKIILLDEGRVSAIGTHRELLNSSSIYREINQSQQKGVLAI